MYVIYSIMSLPSFKFTNIGAPTANERVNSGLSSTSKMEKSGILSSITEKAQSTFKDVKMPDISLDISSIKEDDGDSGSDDGSFFSFVTLIKVILILFILWFMWSSLSKNNDFYLGMGEFGKSMKSFFKSMEKKGREVVSRVTNQPIMDDSSSDSSSDSDSDSDDEDGVTQMNKRQGVPPKIPVAPVPRRPHRKGLNPAAHRPPIPPEMSNSANKQPGFVNDESKYTFLDKAKRNYTGPSPRANDTTTNVRQKQNSGKAGYCYVGEDRGYRSCLKVEAGDQCMSGQVFSSHDVCVNPKLRE
jgi:hypothetical protein